MRNRTKALLFTLATSAAWSQTTPRPAFEVASIKALPPSGPAAPQVNLGLRMDGAQVSVSSFSFKDYIGLAYRLKNYQITGPDWISTDRFQITATIPEGVPQSKIPEMFQTLLEDRFGIKFHMEKKEFPVYALETDKAGLKLQPSPDSAEATRGVNVAASGSAQGVAVNLGNGASYSLVPNHFEARHLTMQVLGGNLERFLDRPVVDQTNAPGAYDFTVELTEEDYRGMLIHAAVNSGLVLPPQAMQAMESASLSSLYSGLQKLGLRLQPKKAPLDSMVIDSSRRTPSDN